MTDRTVLDLYRHDVDAPRGDHYAHWTPDGRRTLATGEFFLRTCAFAEALGELGVAAGDRVMLLSDDRPEWHMVDLAALDIGAVDVPIYSTLAPEQIAYQLSDSGAKVAVAENRDHMAKFLEVRGRCPELEHLVQIEGRGEAGVLAFDDLVATPRGGAEERFWDRAGAVDENDLMTIIYTSGTTGEPKGVMLSHRNMVQNVLGIVRRFTADRSDLALETLPLCHSAERMVGYCYMLRATSKAYCSVYHVGELIAKIRPSVFFAVPRIYEKIHQTVLEKAAAASPVKRSLFKWAIGVGREVALHRINGRPVAGMLARRHALADRLVLSTVREALGGRIRACFTGAAEIPMHVAEFFHAIGIPMLEAYGLTETSPAVTFNGIGPGELRLGTVGRPLDDVEVKLAPDGELLVRGPNVMLGYWNKPEETAEVMDEDGFFATGDIAEIDDDGFVLIVDRKKDLIVTAGGKNVAPQPIESRLKQSPWVDNAVLIGDRRPFIVALISPNLGELERWAGKEGLVVAGIEDLVEHPGVLAKLEEEVTAVNASLARFEQIKRFAVLPVELSVEGGQLTPTLKVKRPVVEEQFKAVIDDLYRRRD
jgi:long-chain acyl-CoA synthetase